MLTSFGGEERYAYKIFVSEHHSWFCVVTKNSMNCIIAIQKGDKILAINAIAAAWQHIDASWLWSGCCQIDRLGNLNIDSEDGKL